jgi:uncharacterized protein YbjT (DUF2867 family)
MRIAVAGGTGTVGQHVVRVARARGHEVVVLSRSTGTDLTTGAGVAAALARCAVAVDALNTPAQTARAARAFFDTTSGILHQEGQRAGVLRVVALSIVGLERAQKGLPYYRAKLAHEDAHRRGGLPVTIVRSTQFHDFPGQILARMSREPVAVVPRMAVQPVDPVEVAALVVEAAEAEGAPPLLQIGGPQREDLVDLARQLLAARGRRCRVMGLALPGAGGRALRTDALLPGPDATLTGPTFREWLDAHGPAVESTGVV